MSELLSPGGLGTIVTALGLAMIYVALWSGLSLLGHEGRTLKAQRYPARRSQPE
jgi:hypothetical protein